MRVVNFESLERRAAPCTFLNLPIYGGIGLREGGSAYEITERLIWNDGRYSLVDKDDGIFSIEDGFAYLTPPPFDGLQAHPDIVVEFTYEVYKNINPECRTTGSFPVRIIYSSDDYRGVAIWDYDKDGKFSVSDADKLFEDLKNNEIYDFNNDNFGDINDFRYIIISEGGAGNLCDVNMDGSFNSGDLVKVLTAGKYGSDNQASWSEGDFSPDSFFNSSDLVFALANCEFDG